MSPEEFIRRFLPLGDNLYRLAFSLLRSQEEAEDAIQDLFLKMWASQKQLDTVRDPASWSYILLRNLCVDRLRARGDRRQEPVPEGLPAEPPPEEDERLLRILSVVRSLTPKNRELLRMRLVEDLPYDEIARQTGQSELALRVAFHRIKNQIKKKI